MIGMKREVTTSFDETLKRIPEALKTEGFGVLTEIDVQETLKKKIGADFRRYRILGACNPTLAHRVLSHDPAIGVMLPCNVVVYEDDAGKTVVIAIDPMQTLAAATGGEVAEVAATVRDKLSKVLERLG